ncbi:MAG TPA: hypothetical protein VHC20_06040 [Candidatus Paceibacterota bacterium]|jgi:hypothetical protein|nr:hypothetical protein [Candidatus Paceibacterota bacterium]
MSGWTDRQREDALERDLTQSILVAYRPPTEPLTAHDRCDACGAQTLYRMHRPPTEEHPLRKGVLDFCGHHYRTHLPELLGDGWSVAVKHETADA